MDHITSHQLDEWLQSAFKLNHSTETALVRVQNDILCSLDKRKTVFLLLLDLSAAFDTVDHATLVSRLTDCFSIKGTPKAWFESYLESYKYYVHVEGEKSSVRSLTSGVPQGSLLGPVLYVLYTKTVADTIKAHKVEYHFYADDTQLYVTFKCDSLYDAYLARTRVKCCVEDINSWMIKNTLKLNDDKTELVVRSSKHQPRPAIASIQVGEETINHVPTVCNLGVLLDQALFYDDHISQLRKSLQFHLKNIGKIRKYLDEGSTETLVQAFVSSN